ncbi:TIGR01212 family radical SAM protein [Clostridiisalibacter paucivorans]|uniref:TIGR01212 family radical SAM protein n=1 Tax=Clostridiisalibacter paucivorans TaxID=408753 RepID=UPI00047A9FBE|nr:TIGR01212 family radical SAM protein [Clostridiisalibacter paucivorans]
MRWLDKRYHSLNYELRKLFGKKVIKLSLNGGFTCPNRDGTIGTKGCLFCSDYGSGEFAGNKKLSIKEQIFQQIDLLSDKWRTGKYIAYFQSFTNTYGTIEDLRDKYEQALSVEGVVGLAIATRPDCLSEDILDLLEEFSNKCYLWVELGLQTIHDDTARLIRRGYPLMTFDDALKRLRSRGINVVVHLILGLPKEDYKDMIESVKYVSEEDIQGVKFHLMHILKGTDLYEYYKEHPFSLLSKNEYISIVSDAIEILDPNIVIHRLTGDGAKDMLIAPRWSLNKLGVLSGIDMELKRRNSYQGIKSE